MRSTAPLTLALTALLLAGCGTDDNESAYDPPTALPSPTQQGSPSPTDTASPTADRTQWATCTTERAALSVSFPSDWTAREHSSGGCAYFDPEPFEVRSASEAPAVAVRLDVENAPYDTVRDAYLRDEVTAQRQTQVAGYPGIRIEDRDTGGPLGPKGRRVSYLADLGSDRTLVLTTNETDAPDFERAVEVLDEMAQRLQRTG